MTGAVARAAPTRGELGVMLAACLLAGAACSLVLGRDLNWDYFNYHGYAALLLRQDRLGQDFFAAGYQGYMNPLAFAPWPGCSSGAGTAPPSAQPWVRCMH